MSTEEFVSVSGVVHFHDAHGIYLDVGGRRVFIPENYVSMPPGSRFAPGCAFRPIVITGSDGS